MAAASTRVDVRCKTCGKSFLVRASHADNRSYCSRACMGQAYRAFAPSADSPQGENARKTHCIHGHELSGDNVYTPATGGRYCKTCRRERAVRDREMKKALLEGGRR